MRFILTVASVAALCLCSPALQAADGIIVVEKTTVNGATDTHRVQIDATHMRAEGVGRNGEKTIMIFDGNRQVLDLIRPDRGTYSEVTRADVEQLSAQLNAALQQMQAQLANMPPAQRERIESMMKGRMGGAGLGAAATKAVYTKAGTDTVGKWTCDKYQTATPDAITSDVCTVSPEALGLSIADFAVANQMMEFFSKILPQGAQQLFAIGSVDAQGYPGIPVRRTSTFAGVTTTTEVTDVSRGAIPESAFQVPEGLQKEPFMKMPVGK